MKIEVLNHAAVKLIDSNKIIYFDPFEIKQKLHDADYIFITHNHSSSHYYSTTMNAPCPSANVTVLTLLSFSEAYFV